MKHIDVNDRRQKVLGAIVESYIESAVPVGSRMVAQRFRRTVSPATIRNVMADLEDMGLITHPHTSAGRVPTDKGYRFYVDSLLEPKRLTREEETVISKLISKKCEDFESLMYNVSKAINMITNVAGVVLTPRLKRSIFKRIEFIPIDSNRLVAVLITKSGIVKNAILEMDEIATKAELFKMAEFLNDELEDMFLSDIKSHLTRKLLEHRDSFYTFLKRSINLLSSPAFLRIDERVYFEGASSLMACPEFKDISKVRLFFRIVEEKKDILRLLDGDMEKEGVKIHIGKENMCRDIQECTVITSNYKIKGRTVGALGAIGPTRMEYGKVISAVGYMSATLGRLLEDLG